MIQHTLSGAGHLQYERHLRCMGPGETMLVVIPHHHRYWIGNGGRWEFFGIAITGQEALRLHRAILSMTGPVFRLRTETIERLAEMSLALREGGAERAGAASAIGYAATMALYDDLLGGHDQAASVERSATIGRVVAYVRQNLDQPLGVGLLADLAGLSRAHFSRVFAECEGMPPAAFVLAERMRRAARLLVNGSASVKDVAGACGFADPNHFAKTFRQSYGTSPTGFRTTGMYAARDRHEGGM